MCEITKGDRILIKLKNSVAYTGDLETFNYEAIELSNVTSKNKTLNCNLKFYRPEVDSIFRLAQNQKECIEFPEDDSTKSIQISKYDFEKLKELTTKYVYIKTHDEKYCDAMSDLSKSENIGLAGIGNIGDKTNPFSLIVVCSRRQVYLFDLLVMKKLRWLKKILESEYITKIIHGGSNLSYSLNRQFGVKLTNVFDTQISDKMISKREKLPEISKSLSECLEYHLNFPPTMLEAMGEELEDNKWTVRPLAEAQNRLASSLVVFLPCLRNRLAKLLLKEYYDLITEKYNTLNRGFNGEI